MKLLELASGEEYLWRPVLAGLCSYRDVNESKVDLGDIAAMNELLSVKEYNDRLLEHEAEQRMQRQQRLDPSRR